MEVIAPHHRGDVEANSAEAVLEDPIIEPELLLGVVGVGVLIQDDEVDVAFGLRLKPFPYRYRRRQRTDNGTVPEFLLRSPGTVQNSRAIDHRQQTTRKGQERGHAVEPSWPSHENASGNEGEGEAERNQDDVRVPAEMAAEVSGKLGVTIEPQHR